MKHLAQSKILSRTKFLAFATSLLFLLASVSSCSNDDSDDNHVVCPNPNSVILSDQGIPSFQSGEIITQKQFEDYVRGHKWIQREGYRITKNGNVESENYLKDLYADKSYDTFEFKGDSIITSYTTVGMGQKSHRNDFLIAIMNLWTGSDSKPIWTEEIMQEVK